MARQVEAVDQKTVDVGPIGSRVRGVPEYL